MSVSIGITLFSGGVDGVEDLLKKADVAMFEAKESGRNCVRFFTEERQASINSRTSMADALRRALENHELALYYQPQVSAAGRVVGAEALVRWFPPQGLPISPAEFIPLAEETSVILAPGEWVFETACSNLQELAGGAVPDRFTLLSAASANVVPIGERSGANPQGRHLRPLRVLPRPCPGWPCRLAESYRGRWPRACRHEGLGILTPEHPLRAADRRMGHHDPGAGPCPPAVEWGSGRDGRGDPIGGLEVYPLRPEEPSGQTVLFGIS